MNHKQTRRQVLMGGAGLALGATLTQRRLVSAQEGTPAAAFPVTIDHAFGQTIIESEPVRIVTLSWINQDVVIALGTIPVAMPFYSWGGDEDGLLPWTHAALGDAEIPTLLDEATELPFEAIVEANPDVIIAAYSGITADEYDLLAQIAPTVAYPEAPFATSWEDTTRIIGKAMGLSAEAEALVDETTQTLANASVDYPQIQGKTFTYGNIGPDGFNIYTTTDVRVQLLTSMGMQPSQLMVDITEREGPSAYFGALSLEEADTIDGQIVIFWFASQEEADTAAESAPVQAIPAVANGAYAPVIGESNVMASSAPSPLSIPYIIDTYVPLLAAAADNVPA